MPMQRGQWQFLGSTCAHPARRFGKPRRHFGAVKQDQQLFRIGIESQRKSIRIDEEKSNLISSPITVLAEPIKKKTS
jgi:hypothetical protein